MQVEIVTVAPAFWPMAVPPLTIMLLLLIASSLALWLKQRSMQNEMPVQENPSELKSALLFGSAYAVFLLVVAAMSNLVFKGGIVAF